MKKIVAIFILLCLFSNTLSAQLSNKKDIDKLRKEAEHYIRATNDTTKGLRLLSQAEEAYNRIGHKEGVLLCNKVLNSFYIERGNYGKEIEYSYKIEPLAKELENYVILSDIYRTRAFSYGQLGLNERSYTEFQTALKYTKKIRNKDQLHYRTAFVYENMTLYFEYGKDSRDSILYYLKKSLQEAKKIKDNNPDVTLDTKYDMIANTNGSMGMFYMHYLQPQRMDLAEKYFLEALQIHNNKKYKIPGLSRMLLLGQLSSFYNSQGNYDKAIEYATNVLALEKKLNSPYDRNDAYAILGAAYFEKNNKTLSRKYLELYDQINDSLKETEKLSIEAPVDQIVSEEKKEHTNLVLIIAGCIAAVLLLAVRLFWKRKNRILHKNYESLIEKLKVEEKPALLIEEINDCGMPSLDKSLNITEATTDALLLKLEKFERSKNIIKKEVNLTWLANHLDTNTRYLSEIINKHKGKSFSNYINGLRINYIVELLYEEPKNREYKISYLAELCGFSSREVFTTIFKKETGISPSYFIDNLKTEINTHNEQGKHIV